MRIGVGVRPTQLTNRLNFSRPGKIRAKTSLTPDK